MPARKPAGLIVRADTKANKAARAQAESALAPARALSATPPAALRGHALAAAAWRRLAREYAELEAVVVTRLDADLLADYCLLLEQSAQLDTMRRVAYAAWLELSQEHDRLVITGADEAAALAAVSVVGAFDAVVKLDGRADRKRALLLQWRQSLYLTPRARAGAAPKTKPAPEPADDLERLLDDVDLGTDGR